MNQKTVRNALLPAMVLMLSACAGLGIPGLPGGGSEEHQVIQLIDYAHRFAAMTAEQQRREYGASAQAFARDGDALGRMRLALLLASPGASVHDTPRAASLLEPMVASNKAVGPLAALAKVLHALLNERASEQKHISQLREQLEARKEGERALREQLEALKSIERTILQRGQESQPRRK